MMSSRLLAANAVAAVIKGGESLTPALDRAQSQANESDRALIAQLCFGTLRFEPRLSEVLNTLVSKPLRPKDTDVRALCLVGLYQLMYGISKPHAVINETVGAAKKLKKPWATGLVNAVLRNYLKSSSEIEDRLTQNKAFISAHPDWLSGMIAKAWPDRYSDIIEANNTQPPLTLRVNLARLSREQASKNLQQANISHAISPLSDAGILLDHAMPVFDIPGFNEGDFSVQDESAQLVAQIIPLKSGDRVLDACSAPGGKACAVLERHTVDLTAVDVDSRRLTRVDENLKRLQLSAQIECADLSKPIQFTDEPFDAIVADVPCSATGVIRRHPDIKQLRQPEDIQALSELQLAITKNLWASLKQGGYLLYATCSTLPRENQKVIESFLQLQDDAQLQPISLHNGFDTGFGWQLFAGDALNHDGFFYALIKKIDKV